VNHLKDPLNDGDPKNAVHSHLAKQISAFKLNE